MIITEGHKNDFGCLMVYPSEQVMKKIVEFSNKVITKDIVYIDPADDGYGVENDPHVTIKYGFTEDLKKDFVEGIANHFDPFVVTLKAITLFNNPKYDVVKFDVESPILLQIRAMVNDLPNEDKYKDYNPHMTISYVKKGSFPLKKEGLHIQIPISRLKYSGKNEEKFFVDL